MCLKKIEWPQCFHVQHFDTNECNSINPIDRELFNEYCKLVHYWKNLLGLCYFGQLSEETKQIQTVKRSFFISKGYKNQNIHSMYIWTKCFLFVNEGKKSFQISKVDYCGTSQRNSLPSVAFPDGGYALETLRGYNLTLDQNLFCILILLALQMFWP